MIRVCRGVRGATVARANTSEAILAATRELLERLIALNDICAEDVASVIFTVTPDLNADFPAKAARGMGWDEIALLCGCEIAVPGSLPRCIRVLILWNTTRPAREIEHCYLNGAEGLRPDRAPSPGFSSALA